MILVRLPYPPTANHLHAVVRGRKVLSKVGRQYYETVAQLVDDMKLTQRLRVEIEAVMPDRRRRDLDNVSKAACDSLTYAGVWNDDGQIDDLRIYRTGEVSAPGHLWVRIWPLGIAVGEQQELQPAA